MAQWFSRSYIFTFHITSNLSDADNLSFLEEVFKMSYIIGGRSRFLIWMKSKREK